ncbi:class I SAM-dependent methyltransferase [Clostridioides mangenotii]|uniref:tRNA (mnm(5)s(2)U34)-methyltransferase n=1 Tax=Metaclostridioides mangenotii TaxID=1540 RepID=UPI00214A4E94|nr:class I SAM-dependent methyltransferase [Clostridioides mangenotii]MCR1955629.1 class I SAM-dependent methyltransferase [Clostridioides mangenotii]
MKKAKYLTKITDINKIYLENIINSGDTVVDATMGNGHDTKYLAEAVGSNGYVYSFDIQKSAIESTRKLLEKTNLDKNVKLVYDGHENILNYVSEEISCVLFNLGYLPRANHDIITKPETTVKALEGSLQLLKPNGVACIAIYTGHTGGLEERNAIYTFAKNLSQEEYNVLECKFLNQINNPPQLIMIEKKK